MALRWNNRGTLGAPVQLVQGHRYLSRWLGESAPGVDCGDILSSVQQAITQGAYSPQWPWQGLVAYGSPPPSFPGALKNFPFTTPGFCPIWIDGVWNAPTTPTIDSKQLPSIPGLFNTDLVDATSGQALVQAPVPPGPCNPTDLTFDVVTGIFRCAGQIIITPTTPPQTPNPPPIIIPTPPLNPLPPVVPPVTPPTQTQEKPKPVWPWIAGGAGALLVVGLLAARR